MGHGYSALSQEFRAGRLRPLTHQTYDIRYLPEALRTMSRAEHIGKLVIRGTARNGEEHALFRAQASYLITGGLGGLGLELAQWLADRGARNYSRRPFRAYSTSVRGDQRLGFPGAEGGQ